jgi:radical SAM-linked protein
MVSDPPQAALPRPQGPEKEPVRTKVRLRFRKHGDLRLVSHHDLMTCFERMLRRAALPFHSTQGFHPKPRLVFALSLALGIVGRDEAAELELDADVPPEEIHARLAREAPPGLEILSVRRIDTKTRGQVASVTYRAPLTPTAFSRGLAIPPDLLGRIAAVLAASECWVERARPQPRRLNLRPYLRDLRLVSGEPGASAPGEQGHIPPLADAPGSPAAVEMDLWVTPNGTARPEEVLGLIGLVGPVENGVVLERTKMELTDEMICPACTQKGTA